MARNCTTRGVVLAMHTAHLVIKQHTIIGKLFQMSKASPLPHSCSLSGRGSGGVFLLAESFAGIGAFERNFRTQHPHLARITHTYTSTASRDWSNFPLLRPTASRIHRHLTSRFLECWNSEFLQLNPLAIPTDVLYWEHPVGSIPLHYTLLAGGCSVCDSVCRVAPPAVYPLGVDSSTRTPEQSFQKSLHRKSRNVIFRIRGVNE